MRHKYLYADTPKELAFTPGLAWCLETVAVLSIFEAAIGKGYKQDITIGYEKPYPGDEGKNPKRSDLAFKERGQGKNWAYVEVKNYGQNGKGKIESDIRKLKSIEKRSQRWMLIYRVRSTEGGSQPLSDLIEKNFKSKLELEHCEQFESIAYNYEDGLCEICLAKVK